MKKFVFISLIMACLPFWAMAQTNDDLYFIPKKKTDKKVPAKVVVETANVPTAVYASPGSTVVVKDVAGNVRDVDEYNRRYTSRDNTFSMENDTLYIEEKPYNERGEWVNGFEGTRNDYEYAMRIIRFRNPRYAIPVSSPLYWEVVYMLPSWEWNVFDDGFYAYVFPTSTNRLWWDWRFNYSWSWGWRSPWYYSAWYGPGYWGGWYPPHHHHHHWHSGHHHPYPLYAGVGGYWGGGHRVNGSSAHNPGVHAGRYADSYNGKRGATVGSRNSRDSYMNGARQNNSRNENAVRSSGRVVTAKDGSSSVRTQRSAVRGRDNNSTYTRPAQGRSSSYDRQSSTRSTVNNIGSGSSYQRRGGAAERGAYRGSSSSRNSGGRSDYGTGSSRSSSSSRGGSYSGGSSRSSSSSSRGGSYSSGSSGSYSVGGGGGGGSVSSGGGGGGGGRSGGGGRR